MTLRNAFTGLATEVTQAALIRSLEFMNRLARDGADRLRVSVDVMPASTSVAVSSLPATPWGNVNTSPSYYAAGAPTSVDAREQLAQIANSNFIAYRNGRWTFT